MHRVHSPANYDLFSILLHWVIAVLTLGLFVSGLWMVDLGYYDDWYYRAPWWHKSVGVVVVLLVLLRGIWSRLRQAPPTLHTQPAWQRGAARSVHMLMNLAIILLGISGYLIVTAKGAALSVFDWLRIPALFNDKGHWVDTAGAIHLWLGYLIIALAAVHALAALKHHFIDRDETLTRMLKLNKGEN